MAPIQLPKQLASDLLKAERMLTDILPEFDKAEACGIDCADLKTVHQAYMDQIGKVRANYLPASK